MRTVTAMRCCRPCMKPACRQAGWSRSSAQSGIAAHQEPSPALVASPQERAWASDVARDAFVVKDQAAARARRQALRRTQQMPANFRATATRATFRPARLRTRW